MSEHIGIALGGGAARGAAHIGVLQLLEDRQHRPDYYAGNSAGSFIAALAAFGCDAAQIHKALNGVDFFGLAQIKLNKMGLISNERMGERIRKTIGDVNIQDAPSPLAIVATDIESGEEIVLTEGPVDEAVMASTCVPGIFTPRRHSGRWLVDGGVVNNVPVSAAKMLGAEHILAVDLNGSAEYGEVEDLIDIALNAMDIAIDNTTRIQLKEADLVVSLKLAQYSRSGAEHFKELVSAGYRGANQLSGELDKLFNPTLFDKLQDLID